MLTKQISRKERKLIRQKELLNIIKTKQNKSQENKIIIKYPSNILRNILMFPINLGINIYKNFLVYVIIFLLFVIAFRNLMSLPLEFLMNYLYIPEFLQNILIMFQGKYAPSIIAHIETKPITDAIVNSSTDNINAVNSLSQELKEGVTLSAQEIVQTISKMENTINNLNANINKLTVFVDKMNSDVVKAVSDINLQQEVTLNLEPVNETLNAIKQGITDLKGVNQVTTEVITETHNVSMTKLNSFKESLPQMLNQSVDPIKSLLTVNHKETIQLIGNNNSLLSNLQLSSMDNVASLKDVLDAINVGNTVQSNGIESLIEATNGNEQIIKDYKAEQDALRFQLEEAAKENKMHTEALKKQFVDQQQEFIKKHTVIGYMQDKLSSVSVETHSSNDLTK